MMADRFLLESRDTRILLGGFAPYELGDVAISGLKTLDGDFSLKCSGGRLSASWSRPLAKGTRIVVPTHFRFSPEGSALESCGAGAWRVTESTKEIAGGIVANGEKE